MTLDWLSEHIRQSAGEVESAGGTLRQFRRTVEERLAAAPLTAWELEFWGRGLQRRLISLNSHWFRLGSGRQTSFGFFVRNTEGLLVGLRRESFTQAAVYAALVTHYGYHRRHVRFEMDFLDVALQDDRGQVGLYAETKASDRVLEKLVGNLAVDFVQGIPRLPLGEGQLPPDAHQKAAHMLRRRPRFFWAVSPNRRLAFTVDYRGAGFRLVPETDVPFHRRADLFESLTPA